MLFRFICLKRLQENDEYCPDFEVRYCCRHDYLLTNQTIDKNTRVKREPNEMSLIDLKDITRNVHAELDSECFITFSIIDLWNCFQDDEPLSNYHSI